MIIVLDTNVLVSGLLKGNSNPGIIMQQVVTGKLITAYDFHIINEYREVLSRPRFQFRQQNVDAILKVIEAEGMLIRPQPLDMELEDPGDLPFIEVAAADKGALLVTGNQKHFKGCEAIGVKLITPAELVSRLMS